VGSIEPQFYDVLLKGLEMSPGKLTARPAGRQLSGLEEEREKGNVKSKDSRFDPHPGNFFQNLFHTIGFLLLTDKCGLCGSLVVLSSFNRVTDKKSS
jgi:hypothetical protein